MIHRQTFIIMSLVLCALVAPRLVNAKLAFDITMITEDYTTACSENCADSGATLGWAFTVTSSTTIDGLGVWDRDSNGIETDTQVGLWTATGDLLANATISNSSTAVESGHTGGRWLFENITPLTLVPGNYLIGALFTQNTLIAQVGPSYVTVPQMTDVSGRTSPDPPNGFQAPTAAMPIIIGPTMRIGNAAPVASVVTITGTASVGEILTGTYSYSDGDTPPDAESGSTYRWVRSDDDAVDVGDTDVVTSTATGGAPGNDEYTVTAADRGKYLFYCVIPAASAGTTTGTEVCSSAAGPVCAGSTATVTATADSGAGSLRQALADVCAGGTISFNTTAFAAPQTITLASELTVDKNVIINGGTNRNVTVSGNDLVRVLKVNNGVNFTLQNITVANGYVNAAGESGGGLFNDAGATTTVNHVTFDHNRVVADANDGGAIANGGTITLDDVVFSHNEANVSGGALFNLGTATLNHTAFLNNISHSTIAKSP